LKDENPKAKQYEKIESADYYKDHNETLEIDFAYYLKALANPLDQVLECTVGKKAKDFTYNIYKQQLVKEKVLNQLKNLFRPKLVFEGEEAIVREEVVEKKKKEKKLVTVENETEQGVFLYTDGASKGNPGKAGAGAVLFDENGKEIMSESKFLGERTNNEAEYEALILGVEMCNSLGIDTASVHLRADSEMMIKQLLGQYKTRKENLLSLYAKVKNVKFKSIAHVYREKNKRADELANIGVNIDIINAP
jgi:ribonuclease HI